MSDRRTNIERGLRILELEKELAELKFTKAQAPPHAAQGLSTNPEIVDHATVRSRITMSSGLNNLGTYNGKSDLETFLCRFHNCVDYFGWNEKDKLFQLKNALGDAAEYVVAEIGLSATLDEIIRLLKLRF